MAERPEVPAALLRRIRTVIDRFPECIEQDAWIGVCWRIRQQTVAHVFGGEDQLFRITFRAEPDEVAAFEHLGPPYFKTDWGSNVVGLVLDRETDWRELRELLTDSYCIQAPMKLAGRLRRPS
ncbi:MmcQ/YjbR family DNA-binding protein [Microlunatus elymi]|uniref:MmcQ/YjbR family DNA-binding protein n=1 Tax=Microlunatus elymi TaxID=2596828 RepID=A0A516Q387_9ACTN|nr:MmcQ/YjbR family DNA-binding protein [Microlunatus elymi]QDP97893.1 MmcQ/YjbR family DNA-binding protein [Microlunatus elymi]